MTKRDEEILEWVGKGVLYTSPLWLSYLLYRYLRVHPEWSVQLWQRYVGILWLLGTVFLLFILGIGWYRYLIRQRERQRFCYLQIVPHIDTDEDPKKALKFVEQLGSQPRTGWKRWTQGPEWMQYLIVRQERGLAFYLGVPQTRRTSVKKALQTAYPSCEVHPIAKEQVPFPMTKGKGLTFRLTRRGRQAGGALTRFQGQTAFEDVCTYLEPGTWMEVLFRPVPLSILLKQVARVQRNQKRQGQTQTIHTQAERETPTKRLKGREKAFAVHLTLYCTNANADAILSTVASETVAMMEQENGLRAQRRRRRIEPNPSPLIPAMHWTSSELTNVLHLPSPTHPVFDDVIHLQKGQHTLTDVELADGVEIGRLRHPTQQRAVKIPHDVLKNHFVLTGRTGGGKSSTALQMVQSMIDAWLDEPEQAPGFTYIDPARETALTILTRLLQAEQEGRYVPWHKVHYVYLGETDHPVGLNLLHKNAGETNDTVAKNIMSIMKAAYPGDTPRMDRILENALLTLLEDKQSHTILGLVPLLINPAFQRAVLPHVRDPILQEFWETELADEKGLKNAIEPILNRLSSFRTSKAMRRMFGQPKGSPDLRAYMDDGHIFLCDLIGVNETNVALTMGHLIVQYYQTSLQRSSGAKLHVLMVDEAHLVQMPLMDKIIAVSRKFSLSLGLITQFVGQFKPFLRSAVRENVGTILTCIQGVESAAAIQDMTAGAFSKEYLQNLPERVVAVYTKQKVKTKGQRDARAEVVTCTVESDPPYVYRPDGKVANYRDQADMKRAFDWGLAKGQELQARDGTSAEQVDEDIARYLLMKPIEEEAFLVPTHHKEKQKAADAISVSSTASASTEKTEEEAQEIAKPLEGPEVTPPPEETPAASAALRGEFL